MQDKKQGKCPARIPLSKTITALLLFCILMASIGGCKGCRHRKRITQDPALYTQQNFSELILDSDFISRHIALDTSLAPYADDIMDFYQRRHYQSAWLSDSGISYSAYTFYNALLNYRQTFDDSSVIAPAISAVFGIPQSEEAYFFKNPLEKSGLEVALTGAFFKYADRAYAGSSVDPRDLEWYIPRRKKDYRKLLDTLVMSPDSYQQYEPVNSYYKALKKELLKYLAIGKKGGLPAVNIPYHTKAGDNAPGITLLKKYLRLTDDYRETDLSETYTDSTVSALKSFQGRMGLSQTGLPDSATIAEMNIPVAERIRQIMLNMERLRWMPDVSPKDYILVNIPEYRVHVYQDSTYLWGMNVVVGNEATATNIFTGRLSVVDFCPYWRVPQSIIKKELLPKLKKDPDYLDELDMEAVNGDSVLDTKDIDWHRYTSGVPFDIRQRPGAKNALGHVAFFFPNNFDIYLHDTPAKSFFNESSRAFSHGCIRLADAEKMAEYVFRNDTTMTPDRIQSLMAGGVEKKFSVHPAIPVFIVYFTAWVDHNGLLNFRHDIYGHDARLAKEIFGK